MAPADLMEAANQLTDIWVQIDEQTANGLAFSLACDFGSGPCVFLRDRAQWEGSVLSWSKLTWTAGTQDQTVDAYDLALTLRFDDSTPDEAAGQLRGVVESEGLTAILFQDPEVPTCEYAANVGADCVPCGGAQECVGSAAYGLELTRVDPLGALPLCGIDAMAAPNIEIAPITCDFGWLEVDRYGCSCTSGPAAPAGIPLWFAVLAIVFRRKRD